MSPISNPNKSTDEVGSFPPHPTKSTPDQDPTLLEQLNGLDRDLYRAVARSHTPTLDEPLRRLSNAANYSRLWFGIAAGLAVFGGRPGRRAALTGIAAVGVASAAANLAVKPLYRRRRPDREAADVPDDRQVKMPESTSFPSGHSASAFAFATAVTSQLPVVGAPLITLASAVAYSRVHTGVHYPGDVVVGLALGIVAGSITRNHSSPSRATSSTPVTTITSAR